MLRCGCSQVCRRLCQDAYACAADGLFNSRQLHSSSTAVQRSAAMPPAAAPTNSQAARPLLGPCVRGSCVCAPAPYLCAEADCNCLADSLPAVVSCCRQQVGLQARQVTDTQHGSAHKGPMQNLPPCAAGLASIRLAARQVATDATVNISPRQKNTHGRARVPLAAAPAVRSPTASPGRVGRTSC